mgnify:CR=1 FL=1
MMCIRAALTIQCLPFHFINAYPRPLAKLAKYIFMLFVIGFIEIRLIRLYLILQKVKSKKQYISLISYFSPTKYFNRDFTLSK